MKLIRVILATVLAGALSNIASAAITHRYSFDDGTANDSVGTANGTLQNGATISGGVANLSGGANGTGGYVNLPGPTIAINTYSALTLEMWLTVNPANTNQFAMAAVLGRTYQGSEPSWDGFQYVMIQSTRQDNASRAAITATDYAGESGVNTKQLCDNIEHYAALTINATSISYYLDGSFIGSAALGANQLSTLSPNLAYLGRSVYAGDYSMMGSVDEFRIWNGALSGSDISMHALLGPSLVPEPSSLALFGLGALVVLRFIRRRSA